jgi:hypothetical protein
VDLAEPLRPASPTRVAELRPVGPVARSRARSCIFEAALQRRDRGKTRRNSVPTSHHHLGITVDELEPVYRAAERRAAERRAAFDDEAFGNHLVELP